MLNLPLPPDYRIQDVLQFHGRDPQSPAERVTANRIVRAFSHAGRACHIELTLSPGQALATGDGPAATLEAVARRLLGLRCRVEEFQERYHQHPVLGPLIAARPGLRIHEQVSLFEALTWAIMGQQVNLAFALKLRRRWIALAGLCHCSGLYCYPEPAAVASLEPDQLRQQQFSQAKARTLVSFAREVVEGRIDLEQSPEQLAPLLLQHKGIGPWTVHYALLRGCAYADASLHGDAAVRRALQRLLGRPLNPVETENWLLDFRPHRSLAAAHLWASLRGSEPDTVSSSSAVAEPETRHPSLS